MQLVLSGEKVDWTSSSSYQHANAVSSGDNPTVAFCGKSSCSLILNTGEKNILNCSSRNSIVFVHVVQRSSVRFVSYISQTLLFLVGKLSSAVEILLL